MTSGTLLVCLLLCGVDVGWSGRVLVMPGEYSHWHNMRPVIEALVDKNHSVTVLVGSSSPTVPHTQKERFDYHVFKVNMEKEVVDYLRIHFHELWMNETISTYEKTLEVWQLMSLFRAHSEELVKGLFDVGLLKTLRDSNYDVLFSDLTMPFSDLMAQKLNIPHVLSMRISFASALERLCGLMPVPPSYVPAAVAQGHLTDRMSFTERVENMLLYITRTAMFQLTTKFTFDHIYAEISGNFLAGFLVYVIPIETNTTVTLNHTRVKYLN
nr:UDP glucuronosyltransferase 2 family polypeptide a6 short isoform [Danio rerio]